MSRTKSRARRRRRQHAEVYVAELAIRLRDLVEKARTEARRTSAPTPGRAAAELLELMGEIERSDSLLWPVLRRAGLLEEEYAEERAKAVQAELAIRLRDLVEEARREARRTSAPTPGRATAAELLELMGEIERSDSLLWPVLRRAGLLAEEYAEERAMAAQVVARRLIWTRPRTAHLRRELDEFERQRDGAHLR